MRASLFLALHGVALCAAERSVAVEKLGHSHVSASADPPASSDPNQQVEKLKFMVDPGSMVCGSTQIKEYIRGDTTGKEQMQIFEMVQKIPWPVIKRVSSSFITSCTDEINVLTQKALKLKVLLDVRYQEEQSEEVDPAKVSGLFAAAVKEAFLDPKFKDPLRLAKLTHCGAVRVPASQWDQDPRRRGNIKAPGGRPPKGQPAADTAIAKFSDAAKALYEEAAGVEKKVVYIDSAKLEEKCCGTFGLPGDCIQASLIDLDEKCDDICRGMDQWVKKRNSDQGFKVASREDSSEVIKQQLVEVQTEAANKQRELRECENAISEMGTFKKDVDVLMEEVHVLKASYEDCRDGLYDAEEEVDETSHILHETQERLDKLHAALEHGGKEKEKLVPLLDKATAIVSELDTLLDDTREELEYTTATLAQLTAANNVIIELKDKVSALLLQMAVTFSRVVGGRIAKAGFEAIDADEALQMFPPDIGTVEGEAFSALGASIDNMTAYCADEANTERLSHIEDHADIAEFCSTLKSFPAAKIGSQLQAAVQGHLDEFRDWFAKTASGYEKFHEWLAPPNFEVRGKFEPMGFQEAMKSFSRTEFFTSYLAKWEHEAGAFYKSYHSLMDTFADRGRMQNELLLKAISTEKKYVTEKGKLDTRLAEMKALLAKIEGLEVDKLAEKELFAGLEKKLAELEDNAKEKEVVLTEAETKFDRSWKTLVGFHGKRTSLAMLFQDIISEMTQQLDDDTKRARVAKRHLGQ